MRRPLVALVLAAAACATAPDAAPEPVVGAVGASPASIPDAAPAPAPVVPRKLLPASTDFTLANGLSVILVPDREVPILAFQMRVEGGSADDPPGKEGTAALLGRLLTKGAGPRDARQFDEDVEFVGGAFGAGAGQRWITVSAEFLAEDADLALELLSDVVARPRLDPAEFEKARGQAIDGLAASRDTPEAVLPRYWTTWLFGAHPLGRPASGDESSLRGLAHGDVVAAAKRQLAPGRARLAVAGDFEPADMRRRIEARLGPWAAGAAPAAPVPAWAGSPGGRVLLVDKPDALQTHFQFGNRGFDRRDPAYPARVLANTILGGRFTSRLNQVLRTEKGLTYGASSWFDDDRFGEFVVSTYTETARSEECLVLAESIYRAFLDGGLTAEELASARAYVQGQFAPGNVETGAQQANLLLDLAFEGVPRAVVDDLFANLDRVTLEDVNRVIRDRFPRKLDWVVVGRAAVCRPFLGRFGTVTECSITDPGWGPRPR